MRRFPVCIITAIFLLVVARPALGYLDPGSGSMLLQLVLGGVAGLLVLLKLFWRRITDGLLGRRRDALAEPPSKPPAER